MPSETTELLRLLQIFLAKTPCNTPTASFLAAWMADQEDLFETVPLPGGPWLNPAGVDENVWAALRKIALQPLNLDSHVEGSTTVFDKLCDDLMLDPAEREILDLLSAVSRSPRVHQLFKYFGFESGLGFYETMALCTGLSIETVADRLLPNHRLPNSGALTSVPPHDGKWEAWTCSPLFKIATASHEDIRHRGLL